MMKIPFNLAKQTRCQFLIRPDHSISLKISVSLAVKDLDASKEFYRKLGFEPMGDFGNQGWAIVSNGTVVIGLFQGMFDKNILTFMTGHGINVFRQTWDPTFASVFTVAIKPEVATILTI